MRHARSIFEQPIHPSWIFYAAIWGIIAGIVGSFIFGIIFFNHLLWLMVAILILIFALRRSTRSMLILATLSGLIIGNLRAAPEIISRTNFTNLVGETVTLNGKIMDDPTTSSGQVTVHLGRLRLHSPRGYPSAESQAAPDNTELVPLAGTIYVQLSNPHVDLERSDEITIIGKVGTGFGTYAASFYRPEFTAVTRSETGDIFARLKHWFATRVRDFIASPAVDLGLGYLVGMKSGLSESFSEALSNVGMTHVVVASGAHLGILIGAAGKLFGKLSKFSGLMFSLLLVLAFVLIVGFTPSMTRAALVTSLSLTVGYVGRKFTPLRLLSFVAALTLLLVPTNFQNLGWQLSFASFFGILVLAPCLQKLLYGGKKLPWLAGMLITSISTSFACAPILIYNFGTLSFLSLVANLIILPTLPYAMLLVFLTGSLSFCAAIAQLFGQLATYLLDFHIFVINFLSEKKMFILELPSGDARIYLLYLPILLLLACLQYRHFKKLLYNEKYENQFRIRDA